MNALPPDIPSRLGDYEVRGAIGHGPNGYVCLVRDRENREFAAKVLHPRYAGDEERCKRFVREALVGRSLVHPRIVRVHRVVPHHDSPLPFYVMDYYPGGHAGKLRGGPLRPILSAVADACDALQHVHARKLVHFDVKPPNLLLGPDGAAYLTDFGTTVTTATEELPGGTVSYMAPEHLAGETADHRADVYSAGVVLYELAVGHLPFTASNAFALQYQIRNASGPPRPEAATIQLPGSVWAIITHAMAPDPNARFATAADLAAAIHTARNELPELSESEPRST